MEGSGLDSPTARCAISASSLQSWGHRGGPGALVSFRHVLTYWQTSPIRNASIAYGARSATTPESQSRAIDNRHGRDDSSIHASGPRVGRGGTSDWGLPHRLRGAVSPTRLVLVDQSFRRAAATAGTGGGTPWARAVWAGTVPATVGSGRGFCGAAWARRCSVCTARVGRRRIGGHWRDASPDDV